MNPSSFHQNSKRNTVKELIAQAHAEAIDINWDKLNRLIKKGIILPIQRNKGRKGSLFSDDALVRLRLLNKKGLLQDAEIPDIRWQLWISGYLDQWCFIREILLQNFPSLSPGINQTEITNQIQDFPRYLTILASRRNPFSEVQKVLQTDKDEFIQLFQGSVAYLAQSYLFHIPYSFDNETSLSAKNFEDLAGNKGFALQENLAAKGLADINYLRSNLEKLKDTDAMKIAEYFSRGEEKGAYKQFQAGIQTIASSTNKKPHYICAKWAFRAAEACLLAAKLNLDHLNEHTDAK